MSDPAHPLLVATERYKAAVAAAITEGENIAAERARDAQIRAAQDAARKAAGDASPGR